MISYTLTRPKSHSLYEHLRNDIIHGVFKANDKLPSKRSLAEQLHISLITVETAYDLLLQEGYIYSRERSGYYVMPLSQYQNPRRSPFAMELLKEEPANPDPLFSGRLWYKTMGQVIEKEDTRLWQKSPSKGCARLRNAIAVYLHRCRSMEVQPEQIIIGSGSESMYENLVRMFGETMTVAIENPGYQQIEAIYTASRIYPSKLTMGKEGIESEELDSCSCRFLHVTPFSSYPSQITATAAKRHEYLEWAYSREGYIIEDDFNSEFFQAGPPLQTLYTLDKKERVIYINTFSKSLCPSLRMGYMILPKSLLPLFDEKAGIYSNTVPLLEQYTLAAFIENGSFEQLINKRRRLSAKKKKKSRKD